MVCPSGVRRIGSKVPGLVTTVPPTAKLPCRATTNGRSSPGRTGTGAVRGCPSPMRSSGLTKGKDAATPPATTRKSRLVKVTSLAVSAFGGYTCSSSSNGSWPREADTSVRTTAQPQNVALCPRMSHERKHHHYPNPLGQASRRSICFYELEIRQRAQVPGWVALRVDPQHNRGIGLHDRNLDYRALRDRNALTVGHLCIQELLEGFRVSANALQFEDLCARITAERRDLGLVEHLNGGNENREDGVHACSRRTPERDPAWSRTGSARAQGLPPGAHAGRELPGKPQIAVIARVSSVPRGPRSTG